MGEDVTGREGAVASDQLLTFALVPVSGEQQRGFQHFDSSLEQPSRAICSGDDVRRQREPLESMDAGRGIVRQEHVNWSRCDELFGFRWCRFL